MRAVVAEFNTYRWAGEMLKDAARLRKDPNRVHGEDQTHAERPVLHA